MNKYLVRYAWLPVVLVMGACTGALQGGTINTKPPQLSQVFCVAPSVKDARSGRPVVGATATIRGVSGVTNADGYVYLNNVIETTGNPPSELVVTATGYKPSSTLVEVTSWHCDVSVLLTPTSLSPLHVQGLKFVDEAGNEWRWAMTDGFSDYRRFLVEGADALKPVLAEAQAIGSNGRRVFGMFDFGNPAGPHLYVSEHPDYYDRLPAFLDLLASYGQYVQFTVFADTGRAMPDRAQQLAHFSRIVTILELHTNAMLELVNEQNAHENGVATASFPRPPPPLLASSGSNGGGSDPTLPLWDYSNLHSERPTDPAKLSMSTTTLAFAIDGFTGWVGTHQPTVVNEPIGCADAPDPGRRINDPAVAYLLGLGTQWGAGGTGHSDAGAFSVMLGAQKPCVAAFLRGVLAK